MIRTVTKREMTQLKKDMDRWWGKLDTITKSRIYNLMEDMLDSKDMRKATEDHRKIIKNRNMRALKNQQRQMEERMGIRHVKNCHLGENWKQCPACVNAHNSTCSKKDRIEL